MSKIVTITFSPCIDKTTTVPLLVSEKKLYCSAPTLEAGGGGINVARAIKKLGGDALAIFPSGGYTGKYFNHLLDKENIVCVIIEAAEETRENIIVLEEKSNEQFRFGMPASRLDESEWKKCLEAIYQVPDMEFLVASGGLPPGIPVNIYAQLAKIAKSKNAKFIVDTPGVALSYAVSEGVFMLKPNLHELASLVGEKEIKAKQAKSIATSIIADGKASMILISMGADGAILVTDNLSINIPSPKVHKKSTVGAGDSMVAGTILYLSEGKSMLESAQYGVACGTAATLNTGTQLCNKDDADKLFNSIHADWVYT